MKKCVDHLGNSYKSTTLMCKHWGVTINVFSGRIRRGWSVKEALTSPKRRGVNGKFCKDHLGNKFESIKDMCSYWNISRDTYDTRTSRGWSVKDSLTIEHRRRGLYGKFCKDHLGNKFNTIDDMTKYWGISANTYRRRIHLGWDIRDALVNEVKIKKGTLCSDHLGNKFISIQEMCIYWGVNYGTYRGRISTGWSLEDALSISK